jgi:hypothetical protein
VFQNNFHAAVYDITNNSLTNFDQGSNYSIPRAVSDNGIVVGYWHHARAAFKYYEHAFIYSRAMGMLKLEDYLRNEGIAFAMDSLISATGISADGRKITGYGMKQGKTIGFYVEIPEIPTTILPVQNPAIESPGYGKIVLKWEAPEAPVEAGLSLTGYKVYKDDVLQTPTILPAATLTYADNSVADGTFIYTVKAVYNDNGVTKESIAGKDMHVTMGKKTLPFFDDFSDYQPGGAVLEYYEILTEIPLSTGSWDVSANTVPFSATWKVQEFGYPHWCAGFLTPPAGTYEESLFSPYFDATSASDLQLSFNVRVPADNNSRLSVEMFKDGQWMQIDNIQADGQGYYTYKTYDVSQFAGKNNIRFRFRAYGTANGQIHWQIDNVELSSTADQITAEAPLVIAAHSFAEEGTVHVNWSDPTGFVELRYMPDDLARGRLSNDVYPMIAANKYPAEDLKAFDGYKLTSISFWRTTYPDPELNLPVPAFKWYVSQGGARLYEAPVVNPQLGWNTVQLAQPITIDASKPLYYGVEVVTCDPRDWPLGSATFYIADPANPAFGLDVIIADGRGNLYSTDGGATWRTISEDGAEFAYDLFCIRATLAKDPAAAPQKAIRGYKLLRNEENVVESQVNMGDLWAINNFTDTDPLPENEEACYTVKIYYSMQEYSDGTTACVTFNGIAPIEAKDGVKVYPNLVKKGESITVQLSDNWKNSVIRIYDLSGKKLNEIPVKAPETTISWNEAGMYLLQVNGDESVKFIVK